MEWIMNHWDDILGIITGAIAVASIIAKLTPTKTDDKWVARILQLVDLLALNNKPTELNK